MPQEFEKPTSDAHSPTTNGTAVEKHTEFYFDDGSIVLSAHSTEVSLPGKELESSGSSRPKVPRPNASRKVVFRVHKSILRSASRVFADMFELSDGSASDIHDGVPLVHMPDSAEDVEAMLDMLYGSSFTRILMKRGGTYAEFPTLMSRNMEMATKYDIETIKEDILDAIEFDWPNDLRQWDARDKHRKSAHIPAPEPASIVVFATRYNLPNVRALALYELCQLDPSLDWDSSSGRGAKWDLLTREDYRDLARIQELQRNISVFGTVDCDNSDEDKHRETKIDLLVNRDYLRAMRKYEEDLEAGKYCGWCESIHAGRVAVARQKFWRDMQLIGEHEPLKGDGDESEGDFDIIEEEDEVEDDWVPLWLR